MQNNKLKAANNRLMERMTQQNERISVLDKRNTKLEFEMQLHLTESENNAKEIQMEKDRHSRLTWPSFVFKVVIKILANNTSP